jgi:L-lactate dehydrogenase complex protein LldE
VIVPSGSCGGMMRAIYPSLFRDDSRLPEIEAFCARVFEFTEFMVHSVKPVLRDLGKPLRVTLHESCHATREMGVRDAPAQLLRQLSSVELVELPRRDECCGFGGTFAVKHADISDAIVEHKIACIEETGAALVLSTDCGCLMQIQGAMERRGVPVKAQHVASFLWERSDG